MTGKEPIAPQHTLSNWKRDLKCPVRHCILKKKKLHSFAIRGEGAFILQAEHVLSSHFSLYHPLQIGTNEVFCL